MNLINGDCLEEMAKLTDDSIDLIAADLPYGTTRCKWDSIIPFQPLWEQYKRILKPNGCIALTASQPFTSALVMSNIKWFRYDLVWSKNYTTGFLNANRMPLRKHETIVIFGPSKINYKPIMRTGKMRRKVGWHTDGTVYGQINNNNNNNNPSISDQYYPTSVLEITGQHQANRLHPSQKPVELFEWIIKTYSNEQDTVLDNCMGSGTTGVAAIKCKRHFIGIEKDEVYFSTATKRIQEAMEKTESITDANE